MLEKLYIKDYLIIKESEIEFTKGLNILTGETGAGKSIIIDALSLILGERADYSLIRKDKDKLIIEGHFNFKNNKKVADFLLSKSLNENDNYIIIRRELLKKGISRNFINDTPVSISDLKELGSFIIDIHSQNEHQSLLSKDTHIDILDTYSTNKEAFTAYYVAYKALQDVISNYTDVLSKKNTLFEKKGYIEFQLKEINNVNLLENEDEELEKELNKLENSEVISAGVSNSINLLYEEEGSSLEKISSVIKELKKLSNYDNTFSSLLADIETAYITLKETADILLNYNSS